MIKEDHVLKIVSNNPELFPGILLIIFGACLIYEIIFLYLEKRRIKRAQKAKEVMQSIHQKMDSDADIYNDPCHTPSKLSTIILCAFFALMIIAVVNIMRLNNTTTVQTYFSSTPVVDSPGTITVAASISKMNLAEYAVDIQKIYADGSGFADTAYEIPDGCHWEAIEYKIIYRTYEHPYVNTKLIGLDGNRLEYNGVKYSSRTFDANENSVRNGNTITRLITYYAVPDGCTDYIIRFGDVAEGDRGMASYYHISNLQE